MAITKYKRKKKIKIPEGYDSRLEYDLHNNELKHLDYHPREKIHYAVPSTYEPDFIYKSKGKTVLVEVKGRFRTSSEARKYRYVRESLKEKEEVLIFLFQDAKKPMPFASKRKDGTKQTHGEWADRHGFTYYCLKKGLPETWLTSLI